ncbi:urease accessory protein UreE (plasmid) [Hafnia alvei]|uniref:urease accessory protein UreE n=1 Tax=Hafnia alvei TaxID=569 RepID=UPI000B68DE6B|nr:urease accessory protein UreE [Hafnia alvei]MBI0278618.1 urease accessory protein UreE [Hafnia alvei]PNL03912.1 urease accessory protein UreE [Hafnia alvei]
MIVITQVLGNCKKDPEWQKEIDGVEVDYLMLDQHDAQKNCCRKKTLQGRDLGISLERHVMLMDGDILLYDAEKRYAVVVHIKLREVMIIDLNPQLMHSPVELAQLGFELGYVLGNQHWKAVIKESQVYIPLTVANKAMESVIRTHGFGMLSCSFVSGNSIMPRLSSSEARLLFGGAEDTGTHVHVAHDEHIHGETHGKH